MNPWLLDGLVIAGYFVLIIGIGLFMGRKETGLDDFALGGRQIPWWAVLASILAAEVSAGTFLGTPGEGYGLRNFTYGQLAIGTVIARIIVAYVFIQRFYELRVVSIYEFLETRFGHATKISSSAVFVVTRALASGSRMFVPAILLVGAWELIKGETHLTDAQTLWLYAGAVGFLVLITAIYTTFGGIKAVVWTDLIQVFLMFGAMFYAMFTLWHSVGGWDAVKKQVVTAPVDVEVVEKRAKAILKIDGNKLTEAEATEKAHEKVAEDSASAAKTALNFWDTGLETNPKKIEKYGWWAHVKSVLETEYTVFSAILASVFVTMATHGTDQDMVQRMLTAPDIRRSRRSLILSGLADIPVALSFTFIGVLLWVYYHLPANAGRRPEGDYFVNFILRELPPGIRGVMAAGLFATAMGSLSTALNALATSFTRDFYVGLFRQDADQHEQMTAARWATAGFALVLAAIGVGTAWVKLTHPEIRIIPIVLGSFGYTYGSLLGIFLVGMTTRTRGSNFGNLLAMAAGFAVVAVFSDLPNDVAAMFGDRLYKPVSWLPVIEFPWRIMFGTVTTFAIAVCFRTPREQVDRLLAHTEQIAREAA